MRPDYELGDAGLGTVLTVGNAWRPGGASAFWVVTPRPNFSRIGLITCGLTPREFGMTIRPLHADGQDGRSTYQTYFGALASSRAGLKSHSTRHENRRTRGFIGRSRPPGQDTVPAIRRLALHESTKLPITVSDVQMRLSANTWQAAWMPTKNSCAAAARLRAYRITETSTLRRNSPMRFLPG